MKDTCNPADCAFGKEYGQEKCPNFIECWWQEDGMDKPILVKDCAPHRILMMLQDLHNRFIGVQKQQAEVCGQLFIMTEAFKMLPAYKKEYIEQQKIFSIEDET